MSDIIDFSQFKKKKEEQEFLDLSTLKKPKLDPPMFTEPTIVTLGVTDSGEEYRYLVLVNLVLENNRQYLALEDVSNPEEGVSIVEAFGEDGVLHSVAVIASDEEFEEVSQIVKHVLEQQNNVQEEDKDDSRREIEDSKGTGGGRAEETNPVGDASGEREQ